MEKMTMRPSSAIPLFFVVVLLLSLPHPSASHCVPRSTSHVFLAPPSPSPHPPVKYDSSQSPAPSSAATSPPSPPPSPSPVASDSAAKINKPITSTTFGFGSHIATGLGLSIKNSCDRTTHPDLCFSSIKPILGATAGFSSHGGSPKVGHSFVLELMVKAAKEQTQLSIAQFSKGASDRSTSPKTAIILKGCVSKYRDACDDFDTVLKAVAAKDIHTAKTYLSGVLTHYSTCTDGDAPGDPTLPSSSAWAVNSQNLVNLVDNCLDLCSLLK